MAEGCSFEVWRRVGGLAVQIRQGCLWVWFMRSIQKGWEVFSKHIRFEVGVGDRVKFWTDQWCGDLPLHLSFPVVYGIAINRETFVDSSLERLGTKARRS